MSIPCIQEEKIGKFQGFMDDCKNMRGHMVGISVAIIIQVCTFLFLWGSLTTTVNNNTKYVWGDLTVMTRENTRNVDKLIAKLEGVKFIGIQEIQKKDNN